MHVIYPQTTPRVYMNLRIIQWTEYLTYCPFIHILHLTLHQSISGDSEQGKNSLMFYQKGEVSVLLQIRTYILCINT